MSGLSDHPTVKRLQERGATLSPPTLTEADLKALVMSCGADDCGIVSLDTPSLADERAHAQRAFPPARVAVSIVKRMNRGPVRSPARSLANTEFHGVSDDVDAVARSVVRALEDLGIPAINPAVAFPMEMDNFPQRGWVISQKIIAEAAGMGRMGLHRSVIHPRFGSFILLGSVLVGAEIEAPQKTLDYNPCFSCRLCVVACPVGAIKPDGYFNLSACLDHNYQQFMGGFANWIEDIADSGSMKEYQRRHTTAETVARWQSLSYGPNYNAAYCIAACPAGEDVLGSFLQDRKAHVDTVVKPLQEKVEPVYVARDSDAADYVTKHYPHKAVRYVRPSNRIHSVAMFLGGIRFQFQRERAGRLEATYHFTFVGAESMEVTIAIKNRSISVKRGYVGEPSLRVKADSRAWVAFLRGKLVLAAALESGAIAINGGSSELLVQFNRCFPKE